MDFIKESIKKEKPSMDELIQCFELIRQAGHIAFIKLDGEREQDWYTILVTFPDSSREMIRNDGSDLRTALINVLTSYVASSPGT